MGPELVTIQQTIDRRVSAILADRGDWPCRKGCDDCCRHLAAIPDITEPEWERLRAALELLSVVQRNEVIRRISALREASGPYTCPFLDLSTGWCQAYEHRPIACRTYGFYIERGQGLYCGRIESIVDRGECSDVVWGNQATIDHETLPLGPKRSLIEWFDG